MIASGTAGQNLVNFSVVTRSLELHGTISTSAYPFGNKRSRVLRYDDDLNIRQATLAAIISLHLVTYFDKFAIFLDRR